MSNPDHDSESEPNLGSPGSPESDLAGVSVAYHSLDSPSVSAENTLSGVSGATAMASESPSQKDSPSPPLRPVPMSNSRKQSSNGNNSVQLISHLPIARDEATKTYKEIDDNWYQYKTLGRTRELLESMICDCNFDPEFDDPTIACGHGSDCINRLTQIECLAGDCRCRGYCQNQRFQKKQYAPIEIVKTEKKGYGLRAEQDLLRDTFIYEYVGDVVSNSSFKKRMRDYANEGIQHFYFMMLQKDEFIDATKSGGIGRFANHSCSPNCYVAKWTIDQHVRMGIFAKRNIKEGEELTFNYNVDRYGHQAQTCYCGEPNCVGFIGGKTQTDADISTMDELYLDALGITDDAELQSLKGTKKRKGKKIDDPDFMPMMKPVVEKEVPKVIQAIRQTQSKKMLFKLLTRLKMTQEPAALRQVMRLRGFSLMKNILEDYKKDLDIIGLALESMYAWPLIAKNKVEDSQITIPVKVYMESEDEGVRVWAEKLLSHWETLELSYRIPRLPRREKEEKTTEEITPPEPSSPSQSQPQSQLQPTSQSQTMTPTPTKPRSNHRQRPPYLEEERDRAYPIKRPRPTLGFPPNKPNSINVHTGIMGINIDELVPLSSSRIPLPSRLETIAKEQAELDKIIAAAREEKVRAEAQAILEQEEKEKEEERKKQKKVNANAEGGNNKKRSRGEREKKDKERKKDRDKGRSGGGQNEDKEVLKEKKLLKLISPVVVKSMSKHAPAIGHERFKRYAKELTEKIAEREKKSSAFQENKLDKLSEEKVGKIKKYAKEYIEKLLRKMDSKPSSRKPSSSTSRSATAASTSASTSLTPSKSMESSLLTPSTSAASGLSALGLGESPSSGLGTPTTSALRADLDDMLLDDADAPDVDAMDMDTDSEGDSDQDAEGDSDEEMDTDLPNGSGLAVKTEGDEEMDMDLPNGDGHQIKTKEGEGTNMDKSLAVTVNGSDAPIYPEGVKSNGLPANTAEFEASMEDVSSNLWC